MTARPARLITGLLAVGAIAVAVAAFAFARERSVERVEAQTDARVGRAVGLAARLDALLRTYGATRDSESAWFEKATTLVADLAGESKALDELLPGISTAPRGRVAELLPVLSETIERARANAEASRTLMALDVIETNGLPASESLLAEMDSLRSATDADLAATRRIWHRWLGASLATWAAAWTIGMFGLLGRTPKALATSQPNPIQTSVARSEPEPRPAPPANATEFADVAALCQTIAQVQREDELPGIMEAATRLLGASGVVMWVPRDGALAVGTFHGYASGLAERLGRVALSDDNLLTQTWHRRTSQVASPDSGRKGAIVMPILGTGGIAGVLAVELQPGVEPDQARLTAARLISAQLGAAVAVPAPDAARAETPVDGDRRVSA